jgi:hypothetical protein
LRSIDLRQAARDAEIGADDRIGPTRTKSPFRTGQTVPAARGLPLIEASVRPPQRAMAASAANSISGPTSVISSAAASEEFPTSAFPSARASISIAPPGGTPYIARPRRGPPCTLVRTPGTTTDNSGRPEGSMSGSSRSRIGRRRSNSSRAIA